MAQLNCLYKHLKKVTFVVFLTLVCFVSFGVFTLKSTSFQIIHTPNKTIIAMKPIYSKGDPMPVPVSVANAPLPKHSVAYNNNNNNNNANMYYPNLKKHHRNSVVVPFRYTSQPAQNMPVAHKPLEHKNPMSIIPNYTQARKTFYRPYVQSVNGYINPKSNQMPKYDVAFQANIPQANTVRHLRPTNRVTTPPQGRTVYTLPVYQEFASIKR